MALLAFLLVGSCSGPPTATQPRGEPSASLPDALPIYLDESQVDVPAAPLSPVEPVYPREARLAGREGDVTLRLRVRADGALVGLEVLAGDAEDFQRAAIEALRDTAFRPGRVGDGPVSSTVTLRVRFRLAD